MEILSLKQNKVLRHCESLFMGQFNSFIVELNGFYPLILSPYPSKFYIFIVQISCGAGKECYIDENTGKGKCECIKECGNETDPRRKVKHSDRYTCK